MLFLECCEYEKYQNYSMVSAIVVSYVFLDVNSIKTHLTYRTWSTVKEETSTVLQKSLYIEIVILVRIC